MRQGGKCPIKPLGCVNVTKVTLRKIKCLKLIGSWFPERSANFYSVLSRQHSTVKHYNTLHFCIKAIRYGLDYISNKRLKFKDLPRIKQPLKITKVKFTLYQPMPLDFLSVPIISIDFASYSTWVMHFATVLRTRLKVK